MTDERFTFKPDDNVIFDRDIALDNWEIEEELNRLHEENQSLKKQKQVLKDEWKKVLDDLAELHELRLENKRLKLKIDGLEYALKHIKRIDVEIDLND